MRYKQWHQQRHGRSKCVPPWCTMVQTASVAISINVAVLFEMATNTVYDLAIFMSFSCVWSQLKTSSAGTFAILTTTLISNKYCSLSSAKQEGPTFADVVAFLFTKHIRSSRDLAQCLVSLIGLPSLCKSSLLWVHTTASPAAKTTVVVIIPPVL